MRRSPRLQQLTAALVAPALPGPPRLSRVKGRSQSKMTAKRKRAEEGSQKEAKQPLRTISASAASAGATPKAGEAERLMTLPRKLEKRYLSGADPCDAVIGVDEAGRGPIAGPVVAAACYFPFSSTRIDGIFDSKEIKTEEERERLYSAIIAAPGVEWATCAVDEKRIDEINILQATLEAMKACSVEVSCRQALRSRSLIALIDGNQTPKGLPFPAQTVIGGDGLEYCIAAASILAKVTRDRIMCAYDKKYPKYGFAKHKGYPTAAHRAAVKEHGGCEIHRQSFATLKNLQLSHPKE